MARPRPVTVRELAAKSGLEVEVILIALWREGIDYVDAPESKVRADDMRRAQHAAGIVGSRQSLISYWEEELNLTRNELVSFLAKSGIKIDKNARKLQTSAVRRLLAYRGDLTRTEEIDPEDLETVPLEWYQVGQFEVTEFLTTRDILEIHGALEQDFYEADDPIFPPGIRSTDLLESAVSRPQSGFFGDLKYQTLPMATAALVHSLVHNHPFHNGNKRTALVSMLVMLDTHDHVLDTSQDELFRFMLSVSAHALLPVGKRYEQLADAEVIEIARWVQQKSRRIAHGERAIPWREVQKILRNLDCEITQHRGDKVRISREIVIQEKGFFRPEKTETLETFFTSTGNGREVPKSQIKRIREALKLDEKNHVDSHYFYISRTEPDTFIAEYSSLLRRLAKV